MTLELSFFGQNIILFLALVQPTLSWLMLLQI